MALRFDRQPVANLSTIHRVENQPYQTRARSTIRHLCNIPPPVIKTSTRGVTSQPTQQTHNRQGVNNPVFEQDKICVSCRFEFGSDVLKGTRIGIMSDRKSRPKSEKKSPRAWNIQNIGDF